MPTHRKRFKFKFRNMCYYYMYFSLLRFIMTHSFPLAEILRFPYAFLLCQQILITHQRRFQFLFMIFCIVYHFPRSHFPRNRCNPQHTVSPVIFHSIIIIIYVLYCWVNVGRRQTSLISQNIGICAFPFSYSEKVL